MKKSCELDLMSRRKESIVLDLGWDTYRSTALMFTCRPDPCCPLVRDFAASFISTEALFRAVVDS